MHNVNNALFWWNFDEKASLNVIVQNVAFNQEPKAQVKYPTIIVKAKNGHFINGLLYTPLRMAS